MKKVDLHVHSTYSDGTNTPKELIKLAENEGLSAIALTDHDTLDGIPDALDAAKNSSVELIPGVELSTNFNNTEVHIVGLFLDHNNKQINDYLIYQRQSRIDRNIQMCEKFCDIGINITYDKMCELYPDAVITRAHFADYLVKKGMPFRKAHSVSGHAVHYCIENNKWLEDLTMDEFKQMSDLFEEDIYEAISMKTCVEMRNTIGAPGKSAMEQAIALEEAYLKEE